MTVKEKFRIQLVITSYSIHYTKLYDAPGQCFSPRRYQLLGFHALFGSEPGRDFRNTADCRIYPGDNLPVFRRCRQRVRQPDVYHQFFKKNHRRIQLVITSYSIHYTKLYDMMGGPGGSEGGPGMMGGPGGPYGSRGMMGGSQERPSAPGSE